MGKVTMKGSSKTQRSRDSQSQTWLRTLKFLDSEGDVEAVKRFRKRIIDEMPADSELIVELTEQAVRRKDRQDLQSLYESLSMFCESRGLRVKSCPLYAQMWQSSLDSVLFFEDSAGKIESSRRLLGSGDCAKALLVLKEVLAREGNVRTVLERMVEGFGCMKDEAGQKTVQDSLKSMRMFQLHEG